MLAWLLAGPLVAPDVAPAQTPLLEALDGGGEAESAEQPAEEAGDPLLAIENALAIARQRQSALEHAQEPTAEGEAPAPFSALERAARLVRVLEERREAQIRTNDLSLGRQAIESGLARDPSELFGVPPPFPVPILDGVLQSWRREVDQEEQHRTVVDDRRANRRLAEEIVEDFDKQRRRLRERIRGEGNEVDRIRLETEQRGIEDQLEIAKEQLALARQRLENATLEHEIKKIAMRQARAALAWVEAHLAPRETDLADAIERLDRDRFELDRGLDVARTRLVSAEGTLRATEERAGRIVDQDAAAFELELRVRRSQLSYRQTVVALLNQQIERLGRMRTTWQHRYAVLGDRLDLDEAPAWRDASEQGLDRLTRLRRIHETELAKLRLELAALLRKVTEPDAEIRDAEHWYTLELEDLEALVGLYQADLGSLDSAIQLEERLRAELLARLEGRDLGERVRSFAAAARAFWSYELSTSEDSPITPGKLLIALTVFLAGYFFARFMFQLLSRRLFPRFGFDRGASSAFASLAFYGLLAAAFLFALRSVNIPLTAFAVVGGAIALGIGFGSQTLVSNFISGLLLLAERPIQEGDLVEVGGVIGTVESIGLRSTRIRTADNFHIIVPNAGFLEANVVNWTHQDPKIRMKVRVGVAYGSPTREVERLLVQAASEHERTLSQSPVAAYFLDFGDSALLFDVRFWIRYNEQTDRPKILSDVRFRIDELLRENGITIAFPQMDVHLDVGDGLAGAVTTAPPATDARPPAHD